MYKVIIVDDEIEILKGLELKVNWEKENFTVVNTFTDANEALNFIKNNNIDLVITDIQMPNINGLDLIKKCKEVKTGIQYVILSAYSEFEYAKEGLKQGVFDYILKPISRKELIEVLSKIKLLLDNQSKSKDYFNFYGYKEYLQENLFFNILDNKIYENFDAACNEAEKLGLNCINKNNKFYKFSYIELSEIENELIILAFQLVIKESIANFNFSSNVFAFPHNDYPYLMNIFISSDCEKNIIKMTIDIISAIEKNLIKYLNLKASIFQGNIFYDFKYTKHDFFSNIKKNHVNKCLDYKKSENKVSMNIEAIKKELTYHIERNDKKGTMAILEKMLQEKPDEFSYSKIILHVLLLFEEIAIKNNLNINFTYSLFLENFKGKYFDYNFIIKFFEDKLNQLFLELTPLNLSSSQEIVYQIKKHIDNNYMDNLNLTDLSKQFYINPTYLSEIFKKVLNISFSEYIAQIRLEQSKILLKNNNLSINNVAILVGFSSGNYFSNVFKKKYGINPNEYKNNKNL